MPVDFMVRRATPADVLEMARVHVDTWRETYRGVMSDEVLDDPQLLRSREEFWTAALTDPRYERNVAAVAISDENLIGIAMSGLQLHSDASQQLYLLYTYAAFYGSGVGTALLDAVIDRSTPASLWVADPNSRAQAFYLKHGFVADGAVKSDGDLREIRMVRTPLASP